MSTTMQRNEDYDNQISMILSCHHCQYSSILKREENRHLKEYLDQMFPLLSSDYYTVSTKVNWWLHDIHDFPRCQNPECSCQLTANINAYSEYPTACSPSCSNNVPIKIDRMQKTKFKKYGSAGFNNPEKRRQTNIEKYGEGNPTGFGGSKYNQLIKDKYGVDNVFQSEEIKEKIWNTKKEKYENGNFDTNKYRETSDKWTEEQIHEMVAKRSATLMSRLGVEFPMQSKEVIEKSMQTRINNCGSLEESYKQQVNKAQQTYFERTGYNHLFSNPTFIKHSHQKYVYDNMIFDSAPEIYIYIWLKDHGIKFEYQPHIRFEYKIGDKTHYYYPDFRLPCGIVEYKGDHFFDKTGNPVLQINGKSWKDKYDCLKANNVIILRHKDILEIIDYVNNLYGKDYVKQFKNSSKE